jgi:DNA (cytosine-5)-methyltransferase 1
VTDFDAVDVFAGPGGWDVAARAIGLSVLGVELDDAACATREATGHATLKADVALLDPRDHPARGLIGSPPCPTFSAAGNGAGRALIAILVGCAKALADGRDTRDETRAEALRILLARKRPPKTTPEKWQARCERDAAMSVLVVEPLRWALANRPEWIALEQVPPVLELWRAFAAILEREGYRCWAGILEAERYGVPQTRERAFLLARSDGPPHPPAPTHQRYVPGEAQRHDVTLEGEIRPWVSMAEALGWQDGPSPSPSVTGGGGATGGVEVFASKGARARVNGAVMRSSVSDVGIDKPNPRSADEPAATVNGKHRSAEWALRATNERPNGATRPAPAPAPAPAPSLAFGHNAPVWVADRPSTNVNGDPRISAPGHDDPAQSGSQQEGAIRVTVQEAAILQGFPPDYPWQGSRTAQFQQIGNAVPPPLALAVLAALLGIDVEPLPGESDGDGESWAHHRPASTVVGTRRSDAGMLIGRQLTEGEGRNVGGHGWSSDGVVRTNNFTAVARDLDGRRTKSGSRPYERPIGAPAPTVDGKVDAWKVEDGHTSP